MLKGKFISNCLSNNIDDIKFAALYYDEIDILKNYVYTYPKPDKQNITKIRNVYECVSNEFIDNLKLLENEGIIHFYDFDDKRFIILKDKNNIGYTTEYTTEYDNLMFNTVDEIMQKVGNKLFEVKEIDDLKLFKFLSNEVEEVHNKYVNELKQGAIVDLQFITTYYANLILEMLKGINNGENIITSSQIIDTYFRDFYLKNNNKKYQIKNMNNVGIETIKQLVPDVSMLSFEDILELRYQCKEMS